MVQLTDSAVADRISFFSVQNKSTQFSLFHRLFPLQIFFPRDPVSRLGSLAVVSPAVVAETS